MYVNVNRPIQSLSWISFPLRPHSRPRGQTYLHPIIFHSEKVRSRQPAQGWGSSDPWVKLHGNCTETAEYSSFFVSQPDFPLLLASPPDLFGSCCCLNPKSF